MRGKRLKAAALIAGVGVIWFVAYHQISDALDRDDDRAWAHYHKARGLKKQGHLDEAEAELKKAIATSLSDDAEFYRALGYHYSATRRYEESIQYYDEAIARDPKLEPYLLRPIAWCYAQGGDPKNAIVRIDQLAAKYPKRFRRKDEDFKKSVEYALERASNSGARVNVLFKYTPAHDVGAVTQVNLHGNFDDTGRQTDAHGYTPLAMKRNGEHFEREVSLEKYSDLPYQVVATSSSGRPIGFERFRINPDGGGSQFVTVASTRDQAFEGLKRQSKLQRRRTTKDGRRRMFILWPDCGSWWFLRPMAERGLAPNVRDLLDRGGHAVMISDPPLTSIAMQRLTRFTEASYSDAFWLQLKGIPFIDGLIDVDYGGEDTLSSRLADRKIAMVDLTFNEPWVQNANDRGKDLFDGDDHLSYKFEPNKSEISPDSIIHDYLDVSRMRALVGDANRAQQWSLATLWDDTQSKLTGARAIFDGANGPDVMLLRLPAVDILTHGFFENTDAYSERNLLLEAVYIYLDEVVGELRASLDEDDLFLLISDHGIKDGLSHHPEAMFIGEGPGLDGVGGRADFAIDRFPHIVFSLMTEGAWPSGGE